MRIQWPPAYFYFVSLFSPFICVSLERGAMTRLFYFLFFILALLIAFLCCKNVSPLSGTFFYIILSPIPQNIRSCLASMLMNRGTISLVPMLIWYSSHTFPSILFTLFRINAEERVNETVYPSVCSQWVAIWYSSHSSRPALPPALDCLKLSLCSA